MRYTNLDSLARCDRVDLPCTKSSRAREDSCRFDDHWRALGPRSGPSDGRAAARPQSPPRSSMQGRAAHRAAGLYWHPAKLGRRRQRLVIATATNCRNGLDRRFLKPHSVVSARVSVEEPSNSRGITNLPRQSAEFSSPDVVNDPTETQGVADPYKSRPFHLLECARFKSG
jgi:hypothetical protein